jgi:hypothetical protein
VASPKVDKESDQNDAVVQIEQEAQSQLHTYGRWLRSQVGGPWPGIVVLLTHGTLPPQDFTSRHTSRYGAVPHVIRWRELHTTLGRIAAEPAAASARWGLIADELRAFLEERNMAASDIRSTDVAAVGLYLEEVPKLDGAFQEIIDEVEKRYREEFTRKGRGWELNSDGKVFWGWLYFANQSGERDTYLSWGIRFPHGSKWWADCDPPLPNWDVGFLNFGTEGRRELTLPSDLRGRWALTGDKKDILTTRHLGEITGNRRFPDGFVSWIEAEMPNVRKLVAANRSSKRG